MVKREGGEGRDGEKGRGRRMGWYKLEWRGRGKKGYTVSYECVV